MMVRALVTVTVVMLAMPVVASAQAVISGRATDEIGRALPGVTVTATPDAAGEVPLSAVTDRSGSYSLSGLRPGIYTVAFSLIGFQPVARGAIEITAERGATVDGSMRLFITETQTLPFGPLPRRRESPRPGAACLHGENETAQEASRRVDALAAMRLIFQAVEKTMPGRHVLPMPTWQTLARSPAVDMLRSTAGPLGDLARRIQWGTDEPLPGWGIAYVAENIQVRFALIDLRDPCSFSYTSSDPEVIPPIARIVPLS